jgi:hypothetical protein
MSSNLPFAAISSTFRTRGTQQVHRFVPHPVTSPFKSRNPMTSLPEQSRSSSWTSLTWDPCYIPRVIELTVIMEEPTCRPGQVADQKWITS